MDGRGGCCIARYATGEPHVSAVDNIMLRFRPIAPKPVAGTTASDGYSSESSDAFFKSGSKKRKYVRDNNNSKRRTRQRKTTSSPEQKNPVPMVTLPLLPETPDPKEYPARDLTPKRDDNKDNNNNNLNKNMPVWLSFENRTPAKVEPYYYFGAMDPAAVRLGGLFSCVKVECVMDTWVEGEGLGSTDEERRVNLSKDTCPGFISDGYGRVTWTNKAYGEMMGHDKCDEGEVTVLLAMKVSAVVPYPSFTCGVRVVQYACGREKNSLTVPCDVWRMDFGGFAWRLDVKAALSLRLGC